MLPKNGVTKKKIKKNKSVSLWHTRDSKHTERKILFILRLEKQQHGQMFTSMPERQAKRGDTGSICIMETKVNLTRCLQSWGFLASNMGEVTLGNGMFYLHVGC